MHAMKSKTLQKHYLARVLGRFPCDENYQYNESHPQGVAALSPFQSSTVAYSCNDNVVGMIDVDLPIETFNVKFGIRRVVLSSTSPSSSPPLSNISSRVIKSARGHGTNALEESVERNKKAGKDQSKHARTLFRCLGRYNS